MPTINQNNQITLREIHTRPDLWKDKIYYLERNPYWNKSFSFLPTPKKYAQILQEFQKEIQKQKDQVKENAETKTKAQERINKIKQELKEWVETIIATYGLEPTEEEQEQIKLLTPALNFFFLHQWQGLLKNIFPQETPQEEETIIEDEPGAGDILELPSAVHKPKLFNEEAEQEIITEILTILEAWKGKTRKADLPFINEAITVLSKNVETKREQWELISDLSLYTGEYPTELNDYLYHWELLYAYNPSEEDIERELPKEEKPQTEQLEVREKIAPKTIINLVKEWEVEREKAIKDYNACFILDHTETQLKFTFQPPRQIFTDLNNFLFYRNNIWYEVVSWQRINSQNAIITTKRSPFLSYYHLFLAKGANGVMHCSPRIANEICQCPSFMESTIYEEYNCDWEPKYGLWKIESGFGQKVATSFGDENNAPYISTVKLEEVFSILGSDSLNDTTYLLLPKGYEDKNTYWQNDNTTAGNKITFSEKQKGLFNEENWQKNTKNELNEHTKFHVNLQFFWRRKLLGSYKLIDFDPKECYLKIKANGSSIIYTLQSKKIWIRWSEDVKGTIEKNKMVGMLSGIVQKVVGADLNEATKSLFHDLNTEESKSQDERESERKTKYDGTAQVASSVMGSLPSMFATSHTKHDYTMSEFALRYEVPSLKLRVEYNRGIFDRYKMEKPLKRNGNEWFNWTKIGNYLMKGYWKIHPHIFEEDKENFFSNIFSKGVYLYEEHPHEYFKEKLMAGKYRSNALVGSNPQIETIFQTDLEETGGHDNVSQAGGGLWVYKTSYIKRKDGTGGNVFETLMDQVSSYRNHPYEDSNKWVFQHPQTIWSTEITMDEYAEYVYDLNFFSSNHQNTRGVKGAKKIIVSQIGQGDRGEIKVLFKGEMEIKKGHDDPSEVGSSIPSSGGIEQMPQIAEEKNDDLLDGLEKINQPEAEEENQQDKEILKEIQRQEEQQQEEQKQKEDELEQEDEQSKERQKQKDKQRSQQKQDQKQKQQEDEDQTERSGNEK